ncbi:carbohydrate-binding module family 48 protein [Collybiopsis luxurians FD-317 M1]|nr:carbohydrate-binding module family 48 protein [Collybiopsis luxurians FD-317 M1]
MGNSQSQNNPASPHPSSALGSRRYPTPRPRTSLTSSNSPRRSSSLRSSTRPQSPPSPSHASLRAPRAPNPGASRSREKEIRDRDKEGRGIRVHHSLRTKKKSLELPDLAPAEFSLSQAVPIPVPGRYQAFSPPPLSDFVDDPSEQSRSRSQSRTRQNNETGDDSISEKADLPYQPIVIRSSIPFPINLQKIVVQQALQAQASSTPTFPSLTSSTQFSSPSRINPQPSEGETTYLVKITWRGGGEEVLLARAGDDDWNGRRKMDREEPGIVAAADGEPKKDASDGGKVIDSATMMEDTGGSETAAPVASNPTPIFSTIIALPRGTHHLRFIVDGQQRVADDLPTAVDDNGSLANYVAVGLGDVEPDTTSDGSSGSHPELSELADSTVPVEVEVEASEITPRPTDVTSFPQVEEYPRIDSHSSFWNDNNSEPPSLSSSPTMQSGAGILSPLTPVTNGMRASPAFENRTKSTLVAASTGNTTKVKSKTKSTTHERKWTQEIPLELLEAATEEENYLAYQNEVENAHA